MQNRVEELENALIRQDEFILHILGDEELPQALKDKYIGLYNGIGIKIETSGNNKCGSGRHS